MASASLAPSLRANGGALALGQRRRSSGASLARGVAPRSARLAAPRPAPGCRSVAAASRRPRRDNFDDEWRAGGGGSGADFGPRGSYRITVNGREIRVSQDEAWKLALPAALLLGGALFVGPLVLAAALGALAVGAAVATAGVAVTAMFFPFLVFAGLGAALTFGTVAFSTAVFVIPNVLAAFTLLAVGGGLLLGWEGISMVLGLAQQQTADQQQRRAADAERDAEREQEREARRLADEAERELRMFDERLRRREREEQGRGRY